jgi:hypothetical protein
MTEWSTAEGVTAVFLLLSSLGLLQVLIDRADQKAAWMRHVRKLKGE